MFRFLVFFILLSIVYCDVIQHNVVGRRTSRNRRQNRMNRGERILDMAPLSSVKQKVLDYSDLEYVGNVSVGTPPQQFVVVLDTGSADFWIADKTCDYTCFGKTRFDSRKSSTAVEYYGRWTLLYGSSAAQGKLAMDTVIIGEGPQKLVIPGANVGQATRISYDFESDPAEGIFGLAFAELSGMGVDPPLISAIKKGLLAQPIFTVYLERHGTANAVPGGLFTYGDIDRQNCRPILGYQPLSSATYYQFTMSSIGFGSFNYRYNQEVFTDSGTSLIGGPKYVIDRIAQQAGATYNFSEEMWTIPCGMNRGTIEIRVGNMLLSITSKNYIIKFNGQCYLTFFDMGDSGFGPTWILGDPVMREYCTIHDIGRKRIGFAKSRQP